jgi:iron complex outermembrane receptor protein
MGSMAVYRNTIAITSLGLAALAASAAEQDAAESAKVMPGIRVEDTSVDDAPYVPKRSSTATRTDTPLNEVPQSITVITSAQIRDQNAQTIQETLRYTAGVHADVYGLDNRGDWFTLRGGSEGSTLLDGLRLPLTGWYGVMRNEPYAFERVEVMRGPASIIAGQNGPGGVVNLVSKQPLADAQDEIGVQFGNNDHKQLAVDFTGPLNQDGTLLYRFVGLARDSGTQVKYADMERQYAAPSLTWLPSDATSLTAYVQYQRDRSGNTEGFFPIAGTLRPAPNGKIGSDVFVGEPDWDSYGGDRWRGGYQLKHRFNEQWSLRHDFRHDRVDGGLRSMYANFWEVDLSGGGYGSNALGDDRTIGRTWYVTTDDSRVNNTDLLLEGHLAFGAIRHTVLVGVDGMRQTSNMTQWEGQATPLDVYAPEYGTFPLPSLDASTGTDQEARTRQWGAVLQDQIKLQERWVLVAGIRRDFVRTEVDGDETNDHRAWSKNFGVVYLANGGWSPYVGYSESFDAQGPSSTGVLFAPKQGEQIEVGLKWMPQDKPVTASAAVYELKEKNRLEEDPNDPNNQIQGGPVTVKGVELETAANLRDWDLLASYTYTRARDESDLRVANVPDHSASLWALHKFENYGWPALRAGIGVRRIGETWDGADSLRTPAVTLMDALLSWDSGSWNYALNASNLTDKVYFATCLNRGDCWFGTRRKLTASASYRW